MNLILITVDCLRADHLSCLGYSKQTTPNLDNLADGGVLFTHAISVAPWTLPSFIAIFTSTYPLMHGGQLYVTNSRPTLVQALKEHGYHTAAFHSNPWLSSFYGYGRGFDTFDDSIQKSRGESMLSKPKELVKRITGTNGKLYEFLSQVYARLILGYTYGAGEALNRKAISWLRGNPSNFFLWIHYMDVHRPYVPASRFTFPLRRQYILQLERKAAKSPNSLSQQDVNRLIELYDTNVSYVDKMIGSLLRTLKESNTLEDTFVIVTADHGEQFTEHGRAFHGLYLYDELIHVPLIITGPGLESQVVNEQVSLLDLAPTILDMLKIEKPKSFLGNSLLPLIGGDKVKTGNLEAISEEGRREKRSTNRIRPRLNLGERKVSLRTGKWKYIYTEGGQGELYDLGTDPKEKENMIVAEPEVAAELRAKIMAHIEFEEKSAATEEELIKAKIRKLKSGRKI